MEHIIFLSVVFLIAMIKILIARKKGKRAVNAPYQKSEVTKVTKCSECGYILHRVPEGYTYGFYGNPFRICPSCGKEHYDPYYHELALSAPADAKTGFSYEAGTYENELSVSSRRLSALGYAAKLCDFVEADDKKSISALKERIASDLQRYIDILLGKGCAPLEEFRLSNPKSYIDTLTYEAHNPDAIRRAANEVLTHYGLNASCYSVEVDYDASSVVSAGGTRGTFTRGLLSGGRIRIVMERTFSEYDTVISIILHECAHAFCSLKGIHLNDPDENEYLTDVAAILLGGGRYILRGYFPSSDYRIGYLRRAECEVAKELCDRLFLSQKDRERMEREQLLSERSAKQRALLSLRQTIEQGKNNLHPGRVIREASIRNRFFLDWKENDDHLSDAGKLLEALTDASKAEPKTLREEIRRMSELENKLKKFSDELYQWQEAEYQQANLPEIALESARGVEALADNGNAFAILERIRFWSAGPATHRDAEISFEMLVKAENADALCAAGVCYLQGLAVEKDPAKAREYLLRAAESGSKDAAKILEKTSFS